MTVLSSPRESTSPRFANAFAHGCKVARIITVPTFAKIEGPIALFGSPLAWNQIEAAQADGRDWYYGDHAFLGPRGSSYRIARSEFQYTGTNVLDGRKRFSALKMKIQPWRKAGRDVLVCPAPAVHAALMGFDGLKLEQEMLATLAQHTDRPLVVRYKATSSTPIELALANAWAVVTYHSNVAIQALMVGVPVFIVCPWATTKRMGKSNLAEIESPYYPDDRDAFFQTLAGHQWTMDEISNGLAWRALEAERAA